MDRFVTRTPTWKTLNYSSVAAQSFSQKKCLTRTPVDNKKPLQQKQLDELLVYPSTAGKGFDVLLASSNEANRENFNANSNDSGLSSASSLSPQHIDNDVTTSLILSLSKNHLGKLADYIEYTAEKENDTYMTITHTPKSHEKLVEPGQQGQKPLEVKRTFNTQVKETPDRPLNTVSNIIMTRIQRDLNSPSAAARMKAIKAMKSPTKSAYSHFDIPHVEQSFHLPEPLSIEEIMHNIVVYVEVRSGEDNRSAGVRKVIEALGARVSLSLNREITHVVFKEGLLSTFKKAKQMNIPIVSILWIEACKNQRRICDPKDYPISNLDRYENPELYSKIKRVKSMQPDSECNKRRIRAKAGGTPKDSTPTQKTGNLKKTSTFIGGTPTSSTNKKKTDISQFFKKIEGRTPSSASKVVGGITCTAIMPESPTTQILNSIDSECYTPLDELKKKTAKGNNNIQNHNEDSVEFSANASECRADAKKTLDFLQADSAEVNVEASIRSNIVVGIKTTINASPLPKTRGRPRKHSVMADCEMETATHSMNTMVISFSTPNKSNNRRSSIHTPKDMSMIVETPSNANIIPIPEENIEVKQDQDKLPKSANRRRTLYTMKTMDETDLMKPETNKETETPTRKSARRRTLCFSKPLDTSEIKYVANKVVPIASTRRRTCFNSKSLEQNQISELPYSNAANTPINVQYRKNLDLTNEIEMNTPTKVDKSSNRRRTLYGAQTVSETNITTSISRPNVTTRSSICPTPTNFQMGIEASSALLDDSDSRSKLDATPVDAKNYKLLEETEQCTTPLIFSSTRQPGNNRRSLFDVSMDIITQRLQCINQSARRSLAPPTPSAEVVNTLEKLMSTPIDIKQSNQLLNSATPKSSMETLNECSNSNDGMGGVSIPETNTLKKKRKLFMPNETLLTPPAAAASVLTKISDKSSEEADKLVSSVSNNTTRNSVTKRRRTLMPISQPQPTTITLKDSTSNTASTPVVRKRRSTLDFEQIQNIKTKDSLVSTPTTKKSSQLKIKAKNTPVLVYTNMHQQQIDVIREAIDKLGLFVLESCVTNATTHLVSLEPRRTLNLLRALARGLWILDYSWIVESLKAGKWLPEESHELQNFSKAIEICRSERQAFGSNYKCDLFRKFGAFYISSQCSPIKKENMRELIILCGGHVVNDRQKARYIIGDANRALEDKFNLTSYWILDSITHMQLMKFNKYMFHLPDGGSASQQVPLERKH